MSCSTAPGRELTLWSTPRILAVAFAFFSASGAVFGRGSLLDDAEVELRVFAFVVIVSFLLACLPVASREYLVGRWARALAWLCLGVVLAAVGVYAAVAVASIGAEGVVAVGLPRGLLGIGAAIAAGWAFTRGPATWPPSGQNVSPQQWYVLLYRILSGYYGWSTHAARKAVAATKVEVRDWSQQLCADQATESMSSADSHEVQDEIVASSPPHDSDISLRPDTAHTPPKKHGSLSVKHIRRSSLVKRGRLRPTTPRKILTMLQSLLASSSRLPSDLS
ncbi:MAG: hypothetical protein Q4P71_06165 [Actinomycetaceae bacterium]|nr:hypothetical protein [Actinomycetaceae bacterium]